MQHTLADHQARVAIVTPERRQYPTCNVGAHPQDAVEPSKMNRKVNPTTIVGHRELANISMSSCHRDHAAGMSSSSSRNFAMESFPTPHPLSWQCHALAELLVPPKPDQNSAESTRCRRSAARRILHDFREELARRRLSLVNAAGAAYTLYWRHRPRRMIRCTLPARLKLAPKTRQAVSRCTLPLTLH